MQPAEPAPLQILSGVEDPAVVVADFFEAFPWEPAPDPTSWSAEAFLSALD